MKKDFDFNEVGKQMPYRIPEGFFERMQAETLAKVEAERKRKKLDRLKVGFAAVLSAAAVWCGAVFFFPSAPAETEGEVTSTLLATADDPMEVYLQQLTDEELAEWIEFSENDIFYELTNENDYDYEED